MDFCHITKGCFKIALVFNKTERIIGLEPLKFMALSDLLNSSLVLRVLRPSSLVLRPSTQPYPRIDKGVKNIEGQIDDDVNQPKKETNAH
jgi:hypothetical protein